MPNQDYPFGPPVAPKRTDDRPQEMDDMGQVRLNPAWVSLEAISADAFTKGPEGAAWIYSVVEIEREIAGEKRMEPVIMLGSEKVSTLFHDPELDDLLSRMQEAQHRQAKAHPDGSAEVLTKEDIKKAIDKLGHPTITAAFTPDGKTRVQEAMMSGELHAYPSKNLVVLNDKSGRYMSVKARGEVDPQEVAAWGEEVRRLFSKHLPGVTVEFQQIKTLRPPENGVIAHFANTVLPPADPGTTAGTPRAGVDTSSHLGKANVPTTGKAARR
jgi:hypothetical protein